MLLSSCTYTNVTVDKRVMDSEDINYFTTSEFDLDDLLDVTTDLTITPGR